ncbi:MAG: hypothetical protein JWR36_1567, partial [Glaciihabitans sp.]|nr:hypothetical protein [Glaciihabitans sp.]
GAVLVIVYFSLGVAGTLTATVTGLFLGLFQLIPWATPADESGSDYSVGLGDDGGNVFGAVLSIIVIVIVVVCVAVVTSAVVLICAPLAGLLSVVLRRLRWPIHLVTYFLFGALVAVAVIAVFGLSTTPSHDLSVFWANPVVPYISTSLIVIAAISAAAAWATIWVIHVFRRREFGRREFGFESAR